MASQPVRVAIDLETTGLFSEQDSIIEIGAVKFAGDDVLETFERFVAPRQPLPYRIQRLTGIRPADLVGAPPLADLVPELRAFLGEYPLVGHSVPFDAAFLRHAGLGRRNPLIDTYELAAALLPNLASYTLEAVGAALGVASPTYHRALADALLARDVLLALLRRVDALDSTTLRRLSQLTVSGEWTPGSVARAALHGRGDRGTGTLGDQMAAKLGLDPAVLGLAVARAPSADLEPAPSAAAGPTHLAGGGTSDQPDTANGTHLVAAAIARCLEEGGTALVEGPSDAHGARASLGAVLAWAIRTDQRALVVAADAAAAARVERELLPAALEELDLAADAVRVAQVRETAAYLCLHRWFGAATLPRNDTLPRELARGLAKLVVWTGATRTGSRGEVALSGQEQVAWERVRAGREFADSSGDCAYRQRGYCFVARAHAAAHAAQVVITTQAALAADLASREHRLLGSARVLVLDAHLFEEELRRAASWSLERRTLQTLLANLAEPERGGTRAGLLHLCAQRLKDAPETAWMSQVARAQSAGEVFFVALARLQSSMQRGGGARENRGDAPEQAVCLDDRARASEAWADVERAWATLETRLHVVARLAGEAGTLAGGSGGGQRVAAAADGIATELLAARRTIDELCARVRVIIETERAGTVAWLRTPYTPPARMSAAAAESANGGGGAGGEAPALQVAPIEVGGLLAPLLAPGRALALVGSSLAVGGEFDYALSALGLPADTPTAAATPDYRAQTLILLPEDAPEPNASAFQQQLDAALVALG
ncbi:MAG TPA: exonuclease domain-containing protein, partial [Ktedonobacterales bacterium]|nr:exonuclease domain-containing protein [Ktedonobacterales bacterium]